MKETEFIAHNKKKWNRFEQLYESKSNDPEELSDLYMDITDDLSYAQTFYKRRTVRVYLNQLAQKVYTGVHKQKGESIKKFISVWQVSLPLEIYRSRKNLLFALIAFIVYTAIGALTTYLDPDFPRAVMGDNYVNMTLENIKNGNPLAVYETDNQIDMFLSITSNNMKVAFMTFVFGFFFTIGTHVLMFYNGVMLGAFQYFFHLKGLLITSFLGIWIHGAFEISAIILAAGAGITAGNGFLFPKSYTRVQSLQLSTKRGLKIMLSLVPFIIIAGFLESYVTANYQNLPEWSKWTLIMLSFAIILFLYVFYPIYVARKYPHLIDKEEVASFKDDSRIDVSKIRSVGETVSDTFRLYRSQFTKLLRINATITFPIIVILVAFQDNNHYQMMLTEHWYDWAEQLKLMMGYGLTNLQDYIVLGCWTFVFALIFSSVFWSIKHKDEKFNWKSFFNYLRSRFLGIWIGNLLLCLTVLLLPWYLLLLALAIIPFYMLVSVSIGLGDEKFGKLFKKGFKFSKQSYGTSLITLFLLLFLTFLVMQPFSFVFSIHNTWTNEPDMRDLLDLATGLVKRVGQIYTEDYMFYANVLRQFVYILFLLFTLPILIISLSFIYYSQVEVTEAKGLWKAFDKFGKRSRNQEKEVDFD